MDRKSIKSIAIIGLSLAVLLGIAVSAQDRSTLTAPNGVAFSEFKGYETWQDVAVSATDHGIKAILGNSVTINAYKEGIPGNGKPFPEGSKWVKIEWTKKQNPDSPYFVEVPDTLKLISFIEKDSKRFPDTSGYGYAQFSYDVKSGTLTPFGKDASFNKEVCYQCHRRVAAQDYIFTSYPPKDSAEGEAK
jgi:hypothetical protein